MNVLTEKTNLFLGGAVTVLSAVFGKYWFLFVGFFVLNVVDYLTGWVKAKFWTKTESSAIGAKGVVKKVSYWVVIGISFFIAYGFTQLGEKLGHNLSFLLLIGWFVLASYIINEIRSIVENFVEMGFRVPTILMTGLAVTEKLLEAKNKEMEGESDERQNKTPSDTTV